MGCVCSQWGVLIGWICLVMGVAGEGVDPRNPEEWRAQCVRRSRSFSAWGCRRIGELLDERAALRQSIALLPRYNPGLTDGRIGYHSAVIQTAKEAYIRWTPPTACEVHAIALVPAHDPSEGSLKAYGFPRRFKIDVLPVGSDQLETVVDWMEEDFPDPELYPVFFAGIDRQVTQVKLTVPLDARADEAAFFALGEFYVFGGNPYMGASDNIVFRKGVLGASDECEMKPSWHISYLADQIIGLGLPVSQKRAGREDLIVISDEKIDLSWKVTLILDLGRQVKVGRVDVWPAVLSDYHGLADFGFPRNIVIDRAVARDFREPLPTKNIKFHEKRPPGFIYSVRSWAPDVRYIRVKLSKMQLHEGRRVLGIGEIVVRDTAGRRLPFQVVDPKGFPKECIRQLSRLGDGYSGGRHILSDIDWIKGLAQRRPLDRRMAWVQAELIAAEKEWQRQQKGLVTAGIFGIGLLSLGMVFFQRRNRKQLLLRQGQRITRDLHDEVGSSLGGIALIAQHLADQNENEALDKFVANLSLLAREANASLREVVWGGSGEDILLEVLLPHLMERAERVLKPASVEVSLPENCPRMLVSLSVKRHLILFFKEAVHNCAKYSAATQVQVSARVSSDHLFLSICDNGVGFDCSLSSKGWGLENMRKRAQELGGEVVMESSPQVGTRTEMQLPLRMLACHLTQGYQTSN